MKKIIALAGVAFALLAFVVLARVPVALAHADIVSCVPAMNGSVSTAPDKLVCKASESLDPKGSSLSVFDAAGVQVDKRDSAVDLNDPDRVTISVSLDTTKLTNGVYMVKWKTLSSADNDEASGEFKFTVALAAQATATSEPTQTLEPTAVPTVAPEATKAPEPTVVPTADSAGTPTTLPATGAAVNFAEYGFVALLGALLLVAGALFGICARR